MSAAPTEQLVEDFAAVYFGASIGSYCALC